MDEHPGSARRPSSLTLAARGRAAGALAVLLCVLLPSVSAVAARHRPTRHLHHRHLRHRHRHHRRPAPPRHAGPQLYGFNAFAISQASLADERSLGATVTRLFVDWGSAEPSPSRWDWTAPDAEYKTLLAGGVRPLIVAFAAPCWARPSTSCNDVYATGPPDPAYDSAWTTYVSDLVRRYPDAAGIEIWNEPNLDQYWIPAADPARYTQLLDEGYGAVKSADPAMPVISGGLLLSPAAAGTGKVAGGYLAEQFLAAMYNAHARMDAIGIHLYPSDYANGHPAVWDPAAMQRWLHELGTVRAAAHEGTQPIWITEMGVSTATQPGWPAAATPAQQATDLGAMLTTAKRSPVIGGVIIHTLLDASVDPLSLLGATLGTASGIYIGDDQIAMGFGVLTDQAKPKPAACVVSKLWGGSLSC
ncbi:MAG: GH39 family glycosyl hydrolase [Solirubrobacteraceae bacterium]